MTKFLLALGLLAMLSGCMADYRCRNGGVERTPGWGDPMHGVWLRYLGATGKQIECIDADLSGVKP